MKKLSFYLVVTLLLLVVSLVFVMQNTMPTTQLNFLLWTIPPTPIGILALFSLILGIFIMWFFSLMVFIGNGTKHRREINEKEKFIKSLENEKAKIQDDLSKLKQQISDSFASNPKSMPPEQPDNGKKE